MRYFLLLLASLFALACGNPAGNRDPLIVMPFAPPSLTTLTPDTVPVNSVPFTMTVNGSNFGTDAVVFWNGTPLSTRFITANQLMAALAPTNLMLTGLVQVYVHTGGMNSNTVDFDVTAQ
jgi:hypothetical protein